MNKHSTKVLYKIKESSTSILVTRLISAGIIIYFILNINNDPVFYGILIAILGFILFIATETSTITATRLGIEIKHFNLLNIFTKKEFIRYKEISNIEFTPSEFSMTIFFLNMFIRSGARSNKKSILIINMLDGREVEFKGLGDELDAESLSEIFNQNK